MGQEKGWGGNQRSEPAPKPSTWNKRGCNPACALLLPDTLNVKHCDNMIVIRQGDKYKAATPLSELRVQEYLFFFFMMCQSFYYLTFNCLYHDLLHDLSAYLHLLSLPLSSLQVKWYQIKGYETKQNKKTWSPKNKCTDQHMNNHFKFIWIWRKRLIISFKIINNSLAIDPPFMKAVMFRLF